MRHTRNIGILLSLVFWATVALGGNEGAEAHKRPISVRIEPALRLPEANEKIGNVIVRYADGTEDAWTLKGTCEDPKVSGDGHVGWIVCELDEDSKSLKVYHGVAVASHLKLCYRGKTVADLAAFKPFIEDWNFTPDGPAHRCQIEGRSRSGVHRAIRLWRRAGRKPHRGLRRAFTCMGGTVSR